MNLFLKKKSQLLLFFSSLSIASLLFSPSAFAIPTAIGDIPTTPSAFVQKIMGIAIGIAGGIAFVTLVYGGFKIISSKGDPDSLQAGREVITSAIAGLIFILFAVLILRVVGINILGLPNFR